MEVEAVQHSVLQRFDKEMFLRDFGKKLALGKRHFSRIPFIGFLPDGIFKAIAPAFILNALFKMLRNRFRGSRPISDAIAAFNEAQIVGKVATEAAV